MSKPIILIGYFSEAAELCEKAGYEIIGTADSAPPEDTSIEYLGNDRALLGKADKYRSIPLFAVPDSPAVRRRLYEMYHAEGFRFETVVSPNAVVSKSAGLGEGCMIQDFCNISANVRLGCCVRVNTMANIMHDCDIGSFSTIAPSSVILGRCSIEEQVYIGANATLLPERRVHRAAVVGAGAVVTKDVGESKTVVGIPAAELIRH